MSRKKIVSRVVLWVTSLLFIVGVAFAANAASTTRTAAGSELSTLWSIIAAGGVSVVFLILVSVAAVACIIYHFQNVSVSKLTPTDFSENLLFLLEKKEYEKAVSLCRQ